MAEHTRAQAKTLRRTSTQAEDILWRILRDRRLAGHKFRRQVPLGPYIADFVCFEGRLIAELDGPVHDDPAQRAHDRHRDAWLRGQGFAILRFPNDLILGGSAQLVVDDIARAIRQWPLLPSREKVSARSDDG